jgi:hypothetical protein
MYTTYIVNCLSLEWVKVYIPYCPRFSTLQGNLSSTQLEMQTYIDMMIIISQKMIIIIVTAVETSNLTYIDMVEKASQLCTETM